MRRSLTYHVALGALLVIAASSAATQTPQWKVYDYSDDGFAASYPSLPDLQKKNVDTPSGTLELRTYLAGAGDAALMVGVCEFGSTAAGKDTSQMLAGAKNSMLANSGSHLVGEKRIHLGANQGVEFEADNDSTHFIARMYMVGTTLYESLVASPLAKPFDQAARFLDSFELAARSKYKPDD